MGALAANNAWGTLSVSITKDASTILLSSTQGDRFPSVVEGTSVFYSTLVDEENNLEIVRCIKREADTFTVIRGVDGTEPHAYKAGAKFELRPVAALFNDKVSVDLLEETKKSIDTGYKDADRALAESLEAKITVIEEGYVTNESLESTLKDRTEANDEKYATKEDTEKDYLPLTGGTITGELQVKGEKNEGFILTGGDLAVRSLSKDGVSDPIGGNARIDGAMTAETYHSTSDRRKKHSIEEINSSNAVYLVDATTPVKFKWNSSGNPDFGFIAQEIEKVFPECVFTDKDGFKTVNYVSLVSVAFAAIKGLKKRVEELEDEIKNHGR